MDGWLKVLVAAACLMVIAGGGYYLAFDQSDRNAAKVADQNRAERDECRQLDEMTRGAAMTREIRDLRWACLEKGYIK